MSASQGSQVSRERAGRCSVHPFLRCACGALGVILEARTQRNNGRRFIKCYNRDKENACALWIWEDLLEDYVEVRVEQAVDYYRNYLAKLIEEMAAEDKKLQETKKELTKCKEGCVKMVMIYGLVCFVVGWLLAKTMA